jgi:hypothetical protein
MDSGSRSRVTQTFNLDDFVIRRPPRLSLGDFIPCVPTAAAEVERLRQPETRDVAKYAHLELVLAEAWLGHLDEVYTSVGALPFRGDTQGYVERLVIDATRHIHNFMTDSVPVWRPKTQHPRFGGNLHRAVEHIVNLRVRARRGGCETCHAVIHLDLHHLHYRSFGCELPADVMKLCRDCHRGRHRIRGWPKDLSWQDGWQWSIHPGEGGQHGGGG